MAIFDMTGLGRRLAGELAGMYGDDYRSLRKDMSGTSDREGSEKGRSICLGIILESFDSMALNTDAVRTFLRWRADGTPEEKRDLTAVGRCRGYEERLADSLAGLYGGDRAGLKSDMAKVRMAGRIDAKEYPEERGICLAMVLDSLEHSSVSRSDVVSALERIASAKERQLGDA